MLMTIVMIVSIIIIFAVIGLTVIVTNKAYEVLPESNKIDPMPDEKPSEEEEQKEEQR